MITVTSTLKSTSRYTLETVLNRSNNIVRFYSVASYIFNNQAWEAYVIWYCEEENKENAIESVQKEIDTTFQDLMELEKPSIYKLSSDVDTLKHYQTQNKQLAQTCIYLYSSLYN